MCLTDKLIPITYITGKTSLLCLSDSLNSYSMLLKFYLQAKKLQPDKPGQYAINKEYFNNFQRSFVLERSSGFM